MNKIHKKGIIIMRKIVHRHDVESLIDLPNEVSGKAEEIAGILDDNYGQERDEVRDLGGFILVVENEEDVIKMEELIDFEYILPEYVELIECGNGREQYTYSLMLLSSDYSISLLIPLRFTPTELLQFMDIEISGRMKA
jgi:hypothetical protein